MARRTVARRSTARRTPPKARVATLAKVKVTKSVLLPIRDNNYSNRNRYTQDNVAKLTQISKDECQIEFPCGEKAIVKVADAKLAVESLSFEDAR